MNTCLRCLVIVVVACALLPAAPAANNRAVEVNRTFKVGADCEIAYPNGRELLLADLKVGDRVSIHFRDANGVFVADRVTLHKGGGGGGKPQPVKAGVPVTDTRGWIASIDLQAKTLVIDTKERNEKPQK